MMMQLRGSIQDYHHLLVFCGCTSESYIELDYKKIIKSPNLAFAIKTYKYMYVAKNELLLF